MSEETELRDRIKRLVDETDDGDSAAKAIIDDLGLTVEERIDEPGKRGINPVQRVVGKWEESDEQEPRP